MKGVSQAFVNVHDKWPDVTSVKDAKNHLRLEIGQCDIDKGERSNGERCAVAQNVKRTQRCDGVMVARSVCYIKRGTTAIRYIVPLHIQKELIAFDRGGAFMPGIYELKKPWANNTLKSKAWRKPHPTKNKGVGPKKTKFSHRTDGIRATVVL